MPRIETETVAIRKGSSYPKPHDAPCRGRQVHLLSDAIGLTQFGVKLVTLVPGAWSSQKHWHEREDEFVHVLEGELTLIEGSTEQVLRKGDSAGWRHSVRIGHHLINRSDNVATFIVVGHRDDEDRGEYPDIDMVFEASRYSGSSAGVFHHKDGTPYETD